MNKSLPIRIRKSKSLCNPSIYETSNSTILSSSFPNTITNLIPEKSSINDVQSNSIIEIQEPVPTITVTPLLDTIEPPDNKQQQSIINTQQAVTKSNISIKACKNVTSKQALLIIPITKFFSNHSYLFKLIEILKGESISLRLVDWFVTNYCKKYNIIYNLNDYKTDQPPILVTTETPSFDNFIIVHSNYKGQLKAYSKRNFDPFCRRNRIRFYYDDNKYFITTVGQLNFFKWALENGIINYITRHLKEIDDDMNNRCETTQKKQNGTKIADNTLQAETNTKKKIQDGLIQIETISKTKKNGGTRKKRKEISISASKSLSIHNYPTTLVFD